MLCRSENKSYGESVKNLHKQGSSTMEYTCGLCEA